LNKIVIVIPHVEAFLDEIVILIPGFGLFGGIFFWQIRLEQASIYNLQAALAVQAGLAVLAAQAVLPEVT